MARLVSRVTGVVSHRYFWGALASVAATALLGSFAACASNPSSSSSGSTSGSSTGASTGSPGSGATSGAVTTGSGTGSTSGYGSHSGSTASGSSGMSGASGSGGGACHSTVPNVDAGSLPLVVDSVFLPSGWMGDGPPRSASGAGPALISAIKFSPLMYALCNMG